MAGAKAIVAEKSIFLVHGYSSSLQKVELLTNCLKTQ